MDTQKFEELLASFDALSPDQIYRVENKLQLIQREYIVYKYKKEDVDDVLDDYNKKPLTDEEWEAYCKRFSLNVRHEEQEINNAFYNTLHYIRHNWDAEETDEDDDILSQRKVKNEDKE